MEQDYPGGTEHPYEDYDNEDRLEEEEEKERINAGTGSKLKRRLRPITKGDRDRTQVIASSAADIAPHPPTTTGGGPGGGSGPSHLAPGVPNPYYTQEREQDPQVHLDNNANNSGSGDGSATVDGRNGKVPPPPPRTSGQPDPTQPLGLLSSPGPLSRRPPRL